MQTSRRLHRAARLALLLMAAAASPAAASPRWPDEQTVGAFVYHADFSLAGYAGFLAETDRLQRDLTATLGVGAPLEPIHVFLFQQRATYERYMRQHFPATPSRRALFIKGRGPGMVFAYRSSELETDLRHECTHALLHAALPVVPLWLDEGLAEYFEVSFHARVYDNPHLRTLRWNAKFGQPPELDRLEQLGQVSEMGQGEYRDAWAWVHFMLHGPPEARQELLSYLAELQAHSPPGQLSQRLRQRLPDLNRRILDHLRTWSR